MSQPETPSPKPKEPGSNKRVQIEQTGPSTQRPQPEGPTLLEDNGQDVNMATTTPNNNPKQHCPAKN